MKDLRQENIRFKKHFYDRTGERHISEGLVRKYVVETDRLLKVESLISKWPDEEKYKLWIKLSNRYTLVIIAVISRKTLYIITAWNKDRKWRNILRR